MDVEKFYQAIKTKQRVYGTLIASTSPMWAKHIKKTGLDFAFIDTEHIPIDKHMLSWMCQAFRGLDTAPIVRIPSPDPYEACQVIDGGAQGVVIPYVESVNEVVDLVGAVKYRPLKGKILHDVLYGGKKLDESLQNYVNEYSKNNLAIVNIESVPAIEALDDILKVPGLDGLIIGPHDLSVSLGVPEQYDSVIFQEAVSLITRKAVENNLSAGLHYFDKIEHFIKWADEGMNIIAYKADVNLFVESISGNIAYLKNKLGDMNQQTGHGGIHI